MSNEVKRAIDTGLGGLYVTQRDVDVILRRVRTEAAPARKQRHPMRMSAALVLAMIVLLIGVSVRLARQGWLLPQNTQLTQQDGYASVMDEAAWQDVVDRAEAYVRAEYDPAAALRNERLFAIECREENGLCIVYFRALNEYETEYTVTVDPVNYAVVECKVQRGVGDGHTAEEIRIGYGRIYGKDWRRWTQEQLHTYATWLRKADTATMQWRDLLTLQSGYVAVREGALPQEQIVEAVLAPLKEGKAAYGNAEPVFPQGTVWTIQGEPRVHYLNAAPNPVWKVAVDLKVTYPDGYVSSEVLLVEVDSVTGDVKLTEAASVWAAEEKEMHLQATIDAMLQVAWSSGERPPITEEEACAAARRHIYAELGGTADLTDPARYTVIVDNADFGIDGTRGSMYSCAVSWKVLYVPVSASDPAYCVYIDFYGNVAAAGKSDPQQMNLDELRYRASNGWALPAYMQVEYLWKMQEQIDQIEPDAVSRTLANTVYIKDPYYPFLESEVCQTLGLRTASVQIVGNMLIGKGTTRIEKLAITSDKGKFLVEVDAETKQIISAVRVKELYDPWYAPYLLQEDMEAAGIAPVPYEGDVHRMDVTDSGVVMGMWVKHIYERYQGLYGADLYTWTQEQLRAFREDMIVSSEVGSDMGVMCLRSTYFPDVPAGAITREDAAERAASAMSLQDAVFEGAVLIGTDDTPVWKVCLHMTNGCFAYAEVNCMTGEVKDTCTTRNSPAYFALCYDDQVEDEYWYRDIVLEQTIEECETTWDRKSNG